MSMVNIFVILALIVLFTVISEEVNPRKKNLIDVVDSNDRGPLLILTYCSYKSTLNRQNFHKDKCIQRKTQSYAMYCLRQGRRHKSKQKSKGCLRLKKHLKLIDSVPEKLQPKRTRMLDVKDYMICGGRPLGQLYNIKKYVCCNGIVVKTNPSHHQCCGKVLVNATHEICCSEKRYPRVSDEQRCCADKLYNSTTHGCFSGQVIDRNAAFHFDLSHDQDLNESVPYNTTSGFEQMYVTNQPNLNLEEKSTYTVAARKSVISLKNSTMYICISLVVVGIVLGVIVCYRKTKIPYCHIKDDQYIPSIQSKNYQKSETKSNTPRQMHSNQTDTRLNNHDSGEDCSLIDIESDDSNLNSCEEIRTGSVFGNVRQNCLSTSNSSRSHQRSPSNGSLESTITCTLRLEDLIKDTTTNDKNLTENLIKDSSTQTTVEKESNRRDMFGNPFKHSCILNKQNLNVELNNSDATMTISEKDVQEKDIEVHVSSHTCLPHIRRKLDINDGCSIISPCMEYDLSDVKQLQDYAVIELKLASNMSEGVQIWRYCYKEDSKRHETTEVPVVQTLTSDLNTFCILHGNRAYVYTKVFSTFVCTKHNNAEGREIELWGVLYAKMQIITDKITLRLTLYVVERLHAEIKDYKKHLDDEQMHYDSKRIAHEKIQLPMTVNDEDVLECELTISNQEQWDFIRDLNNTIDSIEYARNTHQLCEICCQNRSVESAKSTWDIENKPRNTPRIFQCYVYIKTGKDRKRKPVFTVTEDVKRKSQIDIRGECSKSIPSSYDQRPPDVPHKELESSSYPNSDPYQHNYAIRPEH